MKTIIMAGGKGTRIAEIAHDIPKPMIPLQGKPVLQYELACLARSGLTDIMLVTGHLGERIREYFGDGAAFGVSLSYYHEEKPLGTAGALYQLRDQLDEDFLLLCGDLIFDMDFSRLIAFHKEKKALATVVSHPNNHPYDSSLLITEEDRHISGWLSKEDTRVYYKNEVNAGIHILNKALLGTPPRETVDLDRDLLKPNLGTGRIFAYATPEYIKDMGTPDRYKEVSRAVESGLVQRKNLSLRQKAVFIDRDGTVNEPNGFIKHPEDFTLIEGTSKAIRQINEAGWLAILVTNQPVIARGDLSFEELRLIHNKMETDLGKEGAYLDAIYFCPHHQDSGFPGERPEYKRECDCRKPKPGMLLAAAAAYNIDLGESWMVGDMSTDLDAGLAAGCRVVLVREFFEYTQAELERYASNKMVRLHRNLSEFVEVSIA